MERGRQLLDTDVEFIAEGGLGHVYRAVRISTGGVVAIKEIKDIDVSSAAYDERVARPRR